MFNCHAVTTISVSRRAPINVAFSSSLALTAMDGNHHRWYPRNNNQYPRSDGRPQSPDIQQNGISRVAADSVQNAQRLLAVYPMAATPVHHGKVEHFLSQTKVQSHSSCAPYWQLDNDCCSSELRATVLLHNTSQFISSRKSTTLLGI